MEHSESIAKFAEAFANFQAEVTDPKLDAKTDYKTKSGQLVKFKYSSLPEILRTVRPILSKHGIALLQEPKTEGAEVSITTILIHKSGEWIKFEPLKMRANSVSAQEIGSAVTYGRRYNISSVLGLGVEDDDDGNAATSGIENDTSKKQVYEKNEIKKTEPKKQGPQKDIRQYVKVEGQNVMILYPTFDDAVKHNLQQQYLSLSGFNANQCKYVLGRKEYEQYYEVIKKKLEELESK